MNDLIIYSNLSHSDDAILPFIIIGSILFGGTLLICAREAIRDFLKSKVLELFYSIKNIHQFQNKTIGVFQYKNSCDTLRAQIKSKTLKTVNVNIFNNENKLTSVETIKCDTSDVSVGDVIYI